MRLAEGFRWQGTAALCLPIFQLGEGARLSHCDRNSRLRFHLCNVNWVDLPQKSPWRGHNDKSTYAYAFLRFLPICEIISATS